MGSSVRDAQVLQLTVWREDGHVRRLSCHFIHLLLLGSFHADGFSFRPSNVCLHSNVIEVRGILLAVLTELNKCLSYSGKSTDLTEGHFLWKCFPLKTESLSALEDDGPNLST